MMKTYNLVNGPLKTDAANLSQTIESYRLFQSALTIDLHRLSGNCDYDNAQNLLLLVPQF